MTLLLFAALLVGLLALLALDSTFQITANHGQDVITASVTITADAKDYGEVAITGTTPQDIIIAIDPDAIAGYVFLSDVPGSLVTTNTTGGADTITLVAGQPAFWNSKMYWTNGHFANRNPWTKLTFTGSGSTNGTLKYLIMRDSTP